MYEMFPDTQPPTRAAQIREVFDYWVERCTAKGRTPILGNKRRSKINARLEEGYTTSDLKQAVEGALLSPWHTGDNPEGKKYLDIVTIFRDDAQVEKFIELADSSTTEDDEW